MHQPLNRRTMLKASGVSLALPLLESMNPTFANTADSAPKRMVFICTTLGLYPQAWWPQESGADDESSEYLKLLGGNRNDFTLFSGLSHEGQLGRQPHNSEVTWLTAARGPGLDGFKNTISVDQHAADTLGFTTRFPSVVLATKTPKSQSFTSGGVMVPAQTSPARLFAQMFLKGKPREVQQQERRLSEGRSILDGLADQEKRVRRLASASDNAQLDAYFSSLREAERNIREKRGWMDQPKPTVTTKAPTDIVDHANLIGRAQLLMDMIPLIVQTDSSRVISVMIQDHAVVPKVAGVSGEHHNLSHHGRDQSKIQQLKKIETQIVKSFGSLLTQLKSAEETGRSLLDNTTVLFGSNLGNANNHVTDNLPILLAGGGFQHGKYVTHNKEDNQPLCNLFVAMLNKMGIETESFAQSTGALSW